MLPHILKKINISKMAKNIEKKQKFKCNKKLIYVCYICRGGSAG